MNYLRVKDWDEKMSHNDRNKRRWIKLYSSIAHNNAWVTLTDAQRGQLLSIWLYATGNDGVIPSSSRAVQKLCALDAEPDLDLFVRFGFLCESADDHNLTERPREKTFWDQYVERLEKKAQERRNETSRSDKE